MIELNLLFAISNLLYNFGIFNLVKSYNIYTASTP